ncbi:MAG: HAMP domain-containing histidine kinase [Bdellovibrionaceae bacterium]|jgi:signal transduction histidine kinase|nr:HAMP domain-containing histidine kinase [Pseudobdellovibrionaceae bacterium]
MPTNIFQHKVYRQFTLVVFISIMLIEAALLFFSYNKEKNRLFSHQEEVVKNITNQDLNQALVDAHLLNKNIHTRLFNYSRNIIFLSMGISLLTALITGFVFHFLAGKYLLHLIRVNETSEKYVGDIPNNEVGLLIHKREHMLSELEGYRQNLEMKLEDAKHELIQTSKFSLIGEFTAGIVHDIKNPLTVLMGYGKQVAKIFDKSDLSEKDCDLIKKGVGKMNKATYKIFEITDRMGKFSRADVDYIEGLDLKNIVEVSLSMVVKKIEMNHIVVTNSVIDEKVFFWGDQIGIEQVLINLLANASDAMETSEKRELGIAMKDQGDQIHLEVTDTGNGIPEDKLEVIFKSFFTTKKAGKGTGLGLANCLRIMNQHKSEILTHSKVGEGTRFTVVLHKKKPHDFESVVAA